MMTSKTCVFVAMLTMLGLVLLLAAYCFCCRLIVVAL
jgi:hypothetical protein